MNIQHRVGHCSQVQVCNPVGTGCQPASGFHIYCLASQRDAWHNYAKEMVVMVGDMYSLVNNQVVCHTGQGVIVCNDAGNGLICL